MVGPLPITRAALLMICSSSSFKQATCQRSTAQFALQRLPTINQYCRTAMKGSKVQGQEWKGSNQPGGQNHPYL
ncbi:unnamed protein product [Nesidiocoris tenuis]|uniref:Secreted protein n=1 Tax=Nesidiocoris tenuis TaxID=355587 RepID=A0A6H5G5K5_9HEMI|nr:unnamed protein product [Nesidiocoris tenuis]